MGLTDYFTFDGERSSDYGFYASGEGVYNTPEQDYETIEVPGRNGDIVIYNNRFKNVDVTYPCIIEMREEDFPTKISEFRNMLMSRIGYKRLEDTHNPNEFRMGMCKNIIEVNPTEYDLISKTNVVFNCKPQRFLKSGETAVTFPDGGPSSPNLLPYPYYHTTRTSNGITWTDNGDGTITANGTATSGTVFTCVQVTNLTLPAGTYFLVGCPSGGNTGGNNYRLVAQAGGVDYNDWGSGVTITLTQETATRVYAYVYNGKTINNGLFRPMLCIKSEYDGKWYPYWDPTTQIYNPTRFEAKPLLKVTGYGTLGVGDRSVIITGTAGQEIYIDCEIMEAWQMSGTAIIPRNDYVQYVGNQFPVLASGVNGISMSGNITRVEVTPRWWII